MSELLKASYKHLVLQIFFVMFLVSFLFVPTGITALDRCFVKLLPLIVFDKFTETWFITAWALIQVRWKNIQVKIFQTKVTGQKWQFSRYGTFGGTRQGSAPSIDAMLLSHTVATVIVRQLIFKATAELESYNLTPLTAHWVLIDTQLIFFNKCSMDCCKFWLIFRVLKKKVDFVYFC